MPISERPPWQPSSLLELILVLPWGMTYTPDLRALSKLLHQQTLSRPLFGPLGKWLAHTDE